MTKEQLRALRASTGLTQAEFGSALHLSGAFIGEMERGEKPIEPRTAKLAQLIFGKRVTIGKFGERFAVILSSSGGGFGSPPTRIHEVQPTTYPSPQEALVAATAIAEANGWAFVGAPGMGV